MPFPHNQVVLGTLADIDILAVLALTDASGSLYHFILEQVINPINLCSFLYRHQYVLHNDNFGNTGRLFSNREVVLIYRAFEAVRIRHEDGFYDEVKPFLGALLARIRRLPHEILEKSLPSDFGIPNPTKRQRRIKGLYDLKWIRQDYDFRLRISWMHQLIYLRDGCLHREPFYLIHNMHPNPFLEEEILFCNRYIEDTETCRSISKITPNVECMKRIDLVEIVSKLHSECMEKNLCRRLEKACVRAVLHKIFWTNYSDPDTCPSEAFLALFKLPRWKGLWSMAELGYWYAIGLSHYGYEKVHALIDSTFDDKFDILIWLFLGAHHWYRGAGTRQPDLEAEDDVCCASISEKHEEGYIKELIGSISLSDRVWILQQIVRRAPEFGVCRDLATNLFNYFILHDLEHVDFMLCALLDEIVCSRLQYVFEYSIGVAIVDYYGSNGIKPLVINDAREYASKLLRRDQYLYRLLTSSSLDSFISMCKELTREQLGNT
jgi:hypothetical protein